MRRFPLELLQYQGRHSVARPIVFVSSPAKMRVRAAAVPDAAQIQAIYAHYVENDTCTFEEIAPDVEEMEQRIEAISKSGLPYLVAEDDHGAILGYAYATTWKPRLAYRHTVECTVYVRRDVRRRGVASRLVEERDERLRQRGIRVVLGGITQPNDTSVKFHEKHGYEHVGMLKSVGYKFGRWLDVGYWQRTFPVQQKDDNARPEWRPGLLQ